MRGVLKWSAGFGLSFLFIWAVSCLFVYTIPPKVYDPELKAFVHMDGEQVRWISEGWGVTRYGRHGLAGIEDVGAHPEDKVFIWGDSYVQAFQVDDDEKMAQRFTALWNAADRRKLLGVGIGFGGRSIADYWSEMPGYEAVLGVPRLNVIILSNMDDVMPDSPESMFAKFVSSPTFRFLPDASPQERPFAKAVKKLMFRFRLHLFGIGNLAKQMFPSDGPNIFKSLRFAPAWGADKPAPPPPAHEFTPEQREAAWDFLLESLKTRSTAPLVLVYLPHVPRIDDDHALIFTPEDDETAKAFAAACVRHGVDLVDLRRDFLEFYRGTGRLPRGFDNYFPGAGHMNPDGHELTAKALVRYIEEHQHAVLGD